MELGVISVALVEDMASMLGFISSVDQLKNQMIHEVMNMQTQLQSQDQNSDLIYLRGVHDAYVSLIQAIDSLSSTEDSATEQSNDMEDTSSTEQPV